MAFLKTVKLSIPLSWVLPTAVIALYLALLFWIRSVIPSSDRLIAVLSSIYSEYGYEIIFFGALLESLVLINFFIPGILAVSLGAVFARLGQIDLVLMVLFTTIGATVGYIIDFILGYLGIGEIIKKSRFKNALLSAKAVFEKSDIKSLSLWFVHANIGSFVSLAAGTLKIRFLRFFILAFLSTLAWTSFWGILIFSIGEVFLKIFTKYGLVIMLGILPLWILALIQRKAK